MEAVRVRRLHVHTAMLRRQLLHGNRPPWPRGTRRGAQCWRLRRLHQETPSRDLVLSERFNQITDAIAAERQVKGWSRAKKDALIRGDFGGLQELSKRRQPYKPQS